MDNKGQSLIFFVLILPIIILFFVLLIDVTSYELNHNHIKNTIIDNLKVILNNDEKDTNKIIGVIKSNIDDSDVDAIILENEIEIDVSYKHKSFSKKIISNEPTVNYHYCGNYESKEIKNKKCN
jgi:hypothetical protein